MCSSLPLSLSLCPSPGTSKQATDQDTKAAKKAKEKAAAASNSGVGLLQSFFFNKKATPAASATASSSAPTPRSSSVNGGVRDGGNRGADGTPASRAARMNEGNGGVGSGGDGSSGELQRTIDEAVPVEFAGRSWEGYLHHADFIVALMHVGTSLMPKNLIKVCVCWCVGVYLCV